MIVPNYWAEARKQYRAAGRQVTVRRFGWSMSSTEDAAAMADRRAEEALARVVSGEKLECREPKVPYNGAEGVPIREEVLERHGDDVVTRNAYGARCLNSPSALFADVDFETAEPIIEVFVILALLGASAGFVQGSWRLALGLLIASLVLAAPIAKLIRRIRIAVQGGAEALTRQRLTAFLTSHPSWNVRIYRTPCGLRLLATHRPYATDDPEVGHFFKAVHADPIYVRMCLNQHCFRARLTAKPWRIGIASHMRPRPGVWPVAPERISVRAAWIAEYEVRAAGFSSCRYVESLGSGSIDPRIQSVVDLHDRESRSHDATATVA